jgi:hypothetical protein
MSGTWDVWALVRHPQERVLPLLRGELAAPRAQARSLALHTLSKIGAPATWCWITAQHLHDDDDEVARTAWRAATGLEPGPEKAALAADLAGELGRGDFDLKRSLSRALVRLGDVIEPVFEPLRHAWNLEVAAHAAATLRLYDNPDGTFDLTGWRRLLCGRCPAATRL